MSRATPPTPCRGAGVIESSATSILGSLVLFRLNPELAKETQPFCSK
jgi:hypothetical protein